MELTNEDYESLAALGFATARQVEEWVGEMNQGQMTLVSKLVAEMLIECLRRHGPEGQDHKTEMVAAYGRVIDRLREESEALRTPDNPQGPQFPTLGALGN